VIWLKLLGILNWAKKALTAFLGLARRYPLQAALIASLCLAGWLWRGKQSALDSLEREKLAHAETIKTGAKARAAQIALNNANAELSQRIATDAIARRKELADAMRSAVSDYRSRHRVQDYCRRGGPGVAAVPSDPGTPDSPEQDEVLAIPRQDFDALAQDALRGAETRVWLIDQINAGLAVVYPEPKLSGE
jgi:hypothetical protein